MGVIFTDTRRISLPDDVIMMKLQSHGYMGVIFTPTLIRYNDNLYKITNELQSHGYMGVIFTYYYKCNRYEIVNFQIAIPWLYGSYFYVIMDIYHFEIFTAMKYCNPMVIWELFLLEGEFFEKPPPSLNWGLQSHGYMGVIFTIILAVFYA